MVVVKIRKTKIMIIMKIMNLRRKEIDGVRRRSRVNRLGLWPLLWSNQVLHPPNLLPPPHQRDTVSGVGRRDTQPNSAHILATWSVPSILVQ